jgi:hypothetical protein
MVEGPFEVVDYRQPLARYLSTVLGSLPGHLAIDPLPQVVEICQRPAQLSLEGSDFPASGLTRDSRPIWAGYCGLGVEPLVVELSLVFAVARRLDRGRASSRAR